MTGCFLIKPIISNKTFECNFLSLIIPFFSTSSLAISNCGFISIKIYNTLGEEIAELVNETKAAGNYEVSFSASNLASGIYFYRLKAVPTGRQAGSFIETKKMVLMK